MRWIVIGGNGMLGTELVKMLESQGESVLSWDREEVDITNPESVATIPQCDVLVNAAAFTAVDPAEENESAAFQVNATGPQLLAQHSREIGARLVQISTDYVFGGDANAPYGEYAPLAPKSAYGRTKAAGEWAVRAAGGNWIIIRTAWLYGRYGNCFPKTMARLAGERDRLSVVTDEQGQPTWTWDLADLIIRLVRSGAPSGIYHGTSSGQTNWHEFTREIVTSLGKDPAMVGETTAAAFNRPAPRPSYSVLGHDSLAELGVAPIGDWRERWRVAAEEVLKAD